MPYRVAWRSPLGASFSARGYWIIASGSISLAICLSRVVNSSGFVPTCTAIHSGCSSPGEAGW